MKRLFGRVWGLTGLLMRWYLTPVGLLYLGILAAGAVASVVQESMVGLVVAAIILLVGLIPYKLARERRDWLAADRAALAESATRAKKARSKSQQRLNTRIAAERTEVLVSLETVRKEARDVIWSERLYWRATLDSLEETVAEVRGVLGKLESRDDALQSQLGGLEEAIERAQRESSPPDDLREVRGGQ